MAKLIVRFMTVVFELAAILFVIGGGVVGFGYSMKEDSLDIASSIVTVPVGIIGGFIAATIVLGIPLLILRINQNLEEINESLKEIRPLATGSKQSATQDLVPFN